MKKKLFCFITLIVMLIMPATQVFASELNFAAKAELPDNQVNPDVSYFDIKMNPGAQQTLHVQLRNETEKPVTLDVELASATTNLNGVVEYTPNTIKPAKSLQFNMKDYVKAPKQTVIPAKGSTVLDLAVIMPDKSFNGVMAGGITLKEHGLSDQGGQASGKKVAIKNRFSYVIGLLMRQNLAAVPAHVKLNAVKPSQVNARNVILTSMENDTATFIQQVAVDAKIFAKGSNQALYQVAKEGLQIAPDTNFDFPIALAGKALKPGTYVAKLEVYGNRQPNGKILRTTAEGKQHYRDHWTMTKQFTITEKAASTLNQRDVTIKPSHPQWTYILIGAVIVLMALIILLLILLLRRQAKKQAS